MSEQKCLNCSWNRFWIDQYDNLICVKCGCKMGIAKQEYKVNYYK
jgi:hypothetical protein